MTLDSHLPSAAQTVGRLDVAGRGHHQHTLFWKALTNTDCIVYMGES